MSLVLSMHDERLHAERALRAGARGYVMKQEATRKILSDRELEVLRLVARGLKTGEIAKALHRSAHTIETHRASIKRKLGLRASGELAKAAFALTLEEPPAP